MSNKENGFFMLNRGLLNSLIGRDLSKLGLVVYFASNACFADTEYNINGQIIKLKKGSYIYSQLNLSNHFGKSIGWINKQINEMQKLKICENKNTNKYSLIELNTDFILFDSGKQNEKRMKQSNKIDNNNNIYNIIIKDIEKYYFNLSGKNEKIDIDPKYINFDIESFKKSFDNYWIIKNSELTFYNYEYSLNLFLKSKNGFKKFLTAKFEDFIHEKKKSDFEFKKTQEKRQEIINKEKEQINEQEQIQIKKLTWLRDFKKSETYIDNIDNIKHNILIKYPNAGISENVFLAYENQYIKEFFDCPYSD